MSLLEALKAKPDDHAAALAILEAIRGALKGQSTAVVGVVIASLLNTLEKDLPDAPADELLAQVREAQAWLKDKGK